MNNWELGRLGEELVAKHLQGNGITILERNFRCRFGEIDLIAQEGDQVVFIEVKTRRGTNFGLPEEAVHYRKRIKLRKLAEFYLLTYLGRVPECRFDVYSIMVDRENNTVDFRVAAGCF